MSFQARYPGRCVSCDGRIHEGQHVRYEDDFLVHADCPEPEDYGAPARHEQRCPTCFLTHAGECF